MFEVQFGRKADKFISGCDIKLKSRLKTLFETLQQNPVPAMHYDLRKVEGEEDTYRIRLSSYRALYRVYWEERVIRVFKIERRKVRTYRG